MWGFAFLGLIHIPLLMADNGLKLTRIPQISLNFSFDGVKSHGGWWIGRGACPCALISKAHTDPTDLTVLLLMVLNLTEDSQHSCSFRLTQISKIICGNL